MTAFDKILVVVAISGIIANIIAVLQLRFTASSRGPTDPVHATQLGQLARIERLERRVDAIMAHLGIAEPPEPPADPIRDLARGGNKIGAIKLYREQHGVGLREAKEAVEAIMAGNEPPRLTHY